MNVYQFTATGWAIRTGEIQLPTRDAPKEVSRDQVRADVRQAAFGALVECARDLGISPLPSIRWLPLDQRDIRGTVHPDDLTTIWVKPQEPADVAETVAHELKHVQQIHQWGGQTACWAPGSAFSMESRELAARDYGLSVRAAFVAGGPLVEAKPAPAPAMRSAPSHTGSDVGRRIWEEKYAPLHEAARQEVAERQARGRRR